MKFHRYTQEQIQFIRENAEGKFLEELRQLFMETHKVDVTLKSLQGIMYRNGIKNKMKGYSTRFKKGQEPWCKGMKGLDLAGENGRKTQFKIGNTPPSHKPIGSESVHENRVWMKIAEPNKWVKKHRYIWEQENGPIPKGYVLRFADGNPMNVTLDNLFLTPHRVCTSVVKRNREHSNPDLNVSIHVLAELELAIKDAEKRGITR